MDDGYNRDECFMSGNGFYRMDGGGGGFNSSPTGGMRVECVAAAGRREKVTAARITHTVDKILKFSQIRMFLIEVIV